MNYFQQEIAIMCFGYIVEFCNRLRCRRVEYMTTDDEVTLYHRERDVPVPLQKKLELLRHFTEYMDDFLTEGKFRQLANITIYSLEIPRVEISRLLTRIILSDMKQ